MNEKLNEKLYYICKSNTCNYDYKACKEKIRSTNLHLASNLQTNTRRPKLYLDSQLEQLINVKWREYQIKRSLVMLGVKVITCTVDSCYWWLNLTVWKAARRFSKKLSCVLHQLLFWVELFWYPYVNWRKHQRLKNCRTPMFREAERRHDSREMGQRRWEFLRVIL